MDMIPGLIIVTILGLGWGSFATMAIYRLPHGLPWIGNKPFCPNCHHDLSFRDYVSILSFLTRRGTCRYCNAAYERRGLYLFTEIAITLVFVISFLSFNISEAFILVTGLGTALVILTAIEMEHQKLQPQVLLFIFMLALVQRTLMDGHIYGILFHGGLSAVLALFIRHGYFLLKGDFSVSFDYLRYQEKGRFKGPAMEYVFLATSAGMWLGVENLWVVILGAVFLGFLVLFLFYRRLFVMFFALCWLIPLWYNEPIVNMIFTMNN